MKNCHCQEMAFVHMPSKKCTAAVLFNALLCQRTGQSYESFKKKLVNQKKKTMKVLCEAKHFLHYYNGCNIDYVKQ